MSRSWKHHPIIKVQSRYFKRIANRVARRIFDVGESESRRHQFGWSVCDQRAVLYEHCFSGFNMEDVRKWFAK